MDLISFETHMSPIIKGNYFLAKYTFDFCQTSNCLINNEKHLSFIMSSDWKSSLSNRCLVTLVKSDGHPNQLLIGRQLWQANHQYNHQLNSTLHLTENKVKLRYTCLMLLRNSHTSKWIQDFYFEIVWVNFHFNFLNKVKDKTKTPCFE